MSNLQPPKESKETRDPGAHDLETSDEEHFSDASEGQKQTQLSIPTTRVQRTDDQPAHGEVPGTDAYNIRTQDATPDELEIIPEVPKTVVEKVDPDIPSHGEVPGTEAHQIRQADAEPDEVLKSSDVTRADLKGSPTSATNRSVPSELSEAVNADSANDDFDDFADPADDQDGFGAFDDGDQDGDVPAEQPVPSPMLTVPLFDFDGLADPDEIRTATTSSVQSLFPMLSERIRSEDASLTDVNPSFLNERSQSLWSQLVAPPPLQPPNWVRSRIRRLFLVSLGVPVDLDEVLPASKQKKLILPSTEFEQETQSSRRSEDTGAPGSVARLKGKNNSTNSVNSQNSKPERRRRGPPPPPDIDFGAARRTCSTTAEALNNLSEAELQSHLMRLEELKRNASKSLEFWLIQKDSAIGDKEAFEEVIENLVKHAKKIRK